MHYFCTTILHYDKMETATIRKQTSFRLSESLIETLRREAAKRNRSLNNFVESILMAFVSESPNKQKKARILKRLTLTISVVSWILYEDIKNYGTV